VAEDNTELRKLFRDGIERVGFAVIEAATGADLVTRVRQHLTDHVVLIISDVRMPAMDGIAAVTALRAAGVMTPVIFTTAFGDVQTRDAIEKLNGRWIDKPVGVVALRLAVADVLGLAPLVPSVPER
jgi:CheY-like chemotaxis protein